MAKVFASLGIPVYGADERAKMLMEENPEIVAGIRTLFGDDAYLADGRYNKTYVGERVFRDPPLLAALNALVHPAVGKDFTDWVSSRQHAPYVLKEAAIMGRNSGLDRIIVVSSPLSLRVDRIRARDGRSEEQVKSIIRNQKTEEEFLALADFVIRNTEEQFLTPQVLAVDAQLRSLA